MEQFCKNGTRHNVKAVRPTMWLRSCRLQAHEIESAMLSSYNQPKCNIAVAKHTNSLFLFWACTRPRLSFPLQLLHCVFTSLQQFQTAFSVSSSAPGGISHSTSYTPASCQTPQTCFCGRERETEDWSVISRGYCLQVRGPICYFVTYDLCSITVMISFLQKPVSDKSQRLLLKSNFLNTF